VLEPITIELAELCAPSRYIADEDTFPYARTVKVFPLDVALIDGTVLIVTGNGTDPHKVEVPSTAAQVYM
jgi:hypothetical protein